MIKKIKCKKGMTLIEIIVAIAILGIIVVGILGMYRLSFYEIFTAGSRTDNILEVRTIADDLIAQNNIQKFISSTQISAYLNAKGYHQSSSLTDIKIKYTSMVNYYIGAESVKSGVLGYEVTILQFLDNSDKNSVQITTFVVKGGGAS